VITYASDLDSLDDSSLRGFFVGWPAPPSAAQHLAALRGSHRAVLARDSVAGNVVGFVNLISDGVLTAFVPWLEVLPEYQGQGIGTELMRRVLAHAEADGFYSVDLACDPELRPYYERLGMRPLQGMGMRYYGALRAGA
jgi:ribosomal protein S18 acetylase RimI-like enzyme